MKRNIIWNAIGSTLSSFSSLFFLILVTRINGLEDAGIFTYSFSTACVLYTIGVYYGRAYQVTETKNYSDTDYIYNRITTCILMLLTSLLFLGIKHYSGYKTMVLFLLCLFKSLEAFSESLYAIIQKKDKLSLVGKSMTFKTIISLLLFLMVDLFTKNVLLSILTIILINLIIMLCYDRKNIGKIEVSKFNHEINKKLLKAGLFTFAFSILSIYVINASKYAIDGRLSENMQAIYGIIIMPATIMSLFSQFIIQPYLMNIKNKLQNNDYYGFIKLVRNIMIFMFGIGIVAITLAYFIGLPLLEIVYGVSLTLYKSNFLIIMIGSLFYGYAVLISFILIAMRKTFCQFIILLITSIFALCISNYLVIHYELMGASIAYFSVMFIEFIMYVVVMIYFFKKMKKNTVIKYL